MSDEKIRELERYWKETGTTQDEAALLVERVRAGDLDRGQLELAAMCGYEAARMAAGPGDGSHDETWALLDAIEAWKGHDLGVRFKVLRRAALALLRLALESADSPPAPAGVDLRDLLTLADATEVHSRTRTQEFETAWKAITAGVSDESLVTTPLLAGFHEYFAWAYEDDLNAARAGYEALSARDLALASKAIRDEVAPWLLGYRDPVAQRVEAHQREVD